MPTQTINLNDATPPPQAGMQNNKWQADAASLDPTVVRNVSSYTPVFVADTGAGGKTGAVPAPAAGDAALGKVLSAGGGFVIPQLVVGWFVPAGSATAATGVGPAHIAPRVAQLSRVKVVVIATDASNPLTLRIKKNGTAILVTDWTIAAGAAQGSVLTVTNLTPSPLPVAVDDIFTLDIIAGSGTWAFTLQME
jgi:hypothetical protein